MSNTERVKIRAKDLRLGMYVCELDRPWSETPFLFEGFELASPADIQAVTQYCEYVYIDMHRTHVVHMVLDEIREPFSRAGKSASFDQEIQAAESTREQTSSLLKSFIDDIRFGQSVDVQLGQSAVSECVASILRNPDAMLYMAQIRNKGEQSSQHAFNVCVFSILLGRYLGLSPKALEGLGTCGLLHDVGKISIADSLLNKPGRLNAEEQAILRQHPKLGRDILMSARNVYAGAVDVAYCHHEHVDGSGYPRGLHDVQLNLHTKIVSIVETYDDVTSERPYRPARTHLDAIMLLNKKAKSNKFDAKLVERFLACLGTYPPGSIVELSNGDVALVLETNPGQRLRPRILVVRDPDHNPVERLVDMAEQQVDGRGQPYKVKLVRPPGYLDIDPRQYRDTLIKLFN
ncbi:HD-GYP domain, c-di-GMP phosphodiesterase class II (or its inactivated variant) [Methylomagnum ishizawai]|uniref:HD-GYP domain, c-di-GMP phosphodiesterase class II (Or its inactivated variant) n=1 Tax=Methylomagnum ishizawai TaxID=1760988 RepID=A0A1Y6D1Q9_9GAMM|nr:HD-GYP domain-containing protein [Methylomagnum ishizawai]SMF96577.1 HD-GYP domain, c-di-GMP phosphodiesterase class II (or its inactivated variant) [Methylomagnum ishizawai]